MDDKSFWLDDDVLKGFSYCFYIGAYAILITLTHTLMYIYDNGIDIGMNNEAIPVLITVMILIEVYMSIIIAQKLFYCIYLLYEYIQDVRCNDKRQTIEFIVYQVLKEKFPEYSNNEVDDEQRDTIN